jgi:hypothetical protein
LKVILDHEAAMGAPGRLEPATYPEPHGAIKGLLHHWAPALITAPQVVQTLAPPRRF